MIIIQCIFLYGFVVNALASDSTNKIKEISTRFKVTYSYATITLECDVKYDIKEGNFSTFLNCPFTNHIICYRDCSVACHPENCSKMISNCKKNQTDTDIKLTWTIDLTKVKKTGNWSCQYGSIKSNSVTVEKYTVTTRQPFKSLERIQSTTRRYISNEIANIPDIVSTTSQSIQQTQPIYQEHPNEFWLFITHPNVVLVLVCVITISLLFNIFFLIRCALLRSLIDQFVQSHKISESCLYRCFCIWINDGLPKSHQSFSNKPNTGNSFVGYHREDVYDDMSASSQADRHLINNYSQYELEQDSLLARKFWTGSEGSQSIMARQPQFIYATQPKSNYVIVSGPVCANRGHGPFLTPSNTNFLSNSQRTCITDDISRPTSNEYVCNESIIYSQPIKNRPKSFDQFTDGDIAKMTESCPPAPPIRTCTDTQCFRGPTPCADNMQQSINMKNVDLIEHCAHSGVKNTSVENVS